MLSWFAHKIDLHACDDCMYAINCGHDALPRNELNGADLPDEIRAALRLGASLRRHLRGNGNEHGKSAQLSPAANYHVASATIWLKIFGMT